MSVKGVTLEQFKVAFHARSVKTQGKELAPEELPQFLEKSQSLAEVRSKRLKERRQQRVFGFKK